MHLKCRLLSCMTWLQCSYLWYMVFKAYSLSSVCSDLAPRFCLVQVIILVFVNKIFDIFCRGYNILVDQNNNLLFLLGSTVSGNSNNVVIKSINLFLLATNLLLPNKIFIYSRLVHFMFKVVPFFWGILGILYFVQFW